MFSRSHAFIFMCFVGTDCKSMLSVVGHIRDIGFSALFLGF
jgi:hypothetical protein